MENRQCEYSPLTHRFHTRYNRDIVVTIKFRGMIQNELIKKNKIHNPYPFTIYDFAMII